MYRRYLPSVFLKSADSPFGDLLAPIKPSAPGRPTPSLSASAIQNRVEVPSAPTRPAWSSSSVSTPNPEEFRRGLPSFNPQAPGLPLTWSTLPERLWNTTYAQFALAPAAAHYGLSQISRVPVLGPWLMAGEEGSREWRRAAGDQLQATLQQAFGGISRGRNDLSQLMSQQLDFTRQQAQRHASPVSSLEAAIDYATAKGTDYAQRTAENAIAGSLLSAAGSAAGAVGLAQRLGAVPGLRSVFNSPATQAALGVGRWLIGTPTSASEALLFPLTDDIADYAFDKALDWAFGAAHPAQPPVIPEAAPPRQPVPVQKPLPGPDQAPVFGPVPSLSSVPVQPRPFQGMGRQLNRGFSPLIQPMAGPHPSLRRLTDSAPAGPQPILTPMLQHPNPEILRVLQQLRRPALSGSIPFNGFHRQLLVPWLRTSRLPAEEESSQRRQPSETPQVPWASQFPLWQ